jgi:FkbM family methyltransferase
VKIHGREVQVMEAPQDYWGWVAEGRYDFEWKVYDKWLKAEHTFIDLGAWVGAHSLYASGTVKTLVCVDPDPVARGILADNLALLDPRPTVHVYPDAVSNEAGAIEMGSPCLGASTTRKAFPMGFPGEAPQPADTFTCSKIALRDLAKPFPDPLFIKMDIEGMEEEVFLDFEFFKERKPILYVELHPFWWADLAKTRKDFMRICELYGHVENIQTETLLLA